MKGPYQRLRYDLRRVWECPACQSRCRRAGTVTSVLCSCQESQPVLERVWMKLVEDRIQRVDSHLQQGEP